MEVTWGEGAGVWHRRGARGWAGRRTVGRGSASGSQGGRRRGGVGRVGRGMAGGWRNAWQGRWARWASALTRKGYVPPQVPDRQPADDAADGPLGAKPRNIVSIRRMESTVALCLEDESQCEILGDARTRAHPRRFVGPVAVQLQTPGTFHCCDLGQVAFLSVVLSSFVIRNRRVCSRADAVPVP